MIWVVPDFFSAAASKGTTTESVFVTRSAVTR